MKAEIRKISIELFYKLIKIYEEKKKGTRRENLLMITTDGNKKLIIL